MLVGNEKFRNSKISYFINIKPIFLKLGIFTNLSMVFPVVVLVFDFQKGPVMWAIWFSGET
jgi:hypothetical protein